MFNSFNLIITFSSTKLLKTGRVSIYTAYWTVLYVLLKKLSSSSPIIRYAEQTPFFSVATFPSDEEEDKDVAKKGTSALERVTSDYHSGSSSDEESTRTSPLTFDDSRSSQVLYNISSILISVSHARDS